MADDVRAAALQKAAAAYQSSDDKGAVAYSLSGAAFPSGPGAFAAAPGKSGALQKAAAAYKSSDDSGAIDAYVAAGGE